MVTLHFSDGDVSPVRMVKVTCAGLVMVTFLSWMANAKTSSCIVRILVGNRNGSILRSVGSNSMPLLVLYSRHAWHVVCQHMHKVVLFLLRGGIFCFGFVGSFGFAGLPVVYKTWVTQVCLPAGHAPFGRRSVGALPL